MKLELTPENAGVVKRHSLEANVAGVSKDGEISWVYAGAALEVTRSRTNTVLASWRFGKVSKDPEALITSVTHLKHEGRHILLVATTSQTDQNLLSFFSVSLRKVICAVEIPQRITALEVLFSGANEEIPSWVLSKHLHFFSGLAAVGTDGGYIYLLDLRLDDLLTSHTATEMVPNKISVMSPKIVDPKAKRDQARMFNQHIALLLDEQCHRFGQFYYRRQDDSVQCVLDEDTVFVTSLKYMTQVGTLAVGFNFGCFQLWRLYNPVLDYSSRHDPGGAAVSNFVVQEPENDPRNFVYLWVVFDDTVNNNPDSIANICLYQLSYTKKDLYAGFGIFYDELETVYPRLDHNLTLDPYSHDCKSTWNSSVISSFIISNPFYSPPEKLSDSFEDNLQGNDLGLSVFVFRAEGKQGAVGAKYWLCVFDLNRWYHAQMPHSIWSRGSSLQVCSYWAVYTLDDIVSQSSPDTLLNVEIVGDRVLRFVNNSPLPPEEHIFPSALQLTGVRFITTGGCVEAQCHGWQGQLLVDLARNGAQYLVQPADFYHKCLQARILPQNVDSVKCSNVDLQRKALLTLALQHGVSVLLVQQCVQLWGDGEFTGQGCTLSLLLDWAWESTVSIKQELDSACGLLYDWSNQHVDPRLDWKLQSLTESLSHLKQVFSCLVSQSSPTTDTGQMELELRQDVVNLLVQHYDVVRWCLAFNLLPEMDETSDPIPELFAYPISDLCQIYKKKRAELRTARGVVDGLSLLLIDNLVTCQGDHIKNLWETEGGDGLYPPPSMQAVMHMYLLEEVSLEVKQAITLFLLRDLVAFIKADSGESIMASFIQRFMLSPNLVHQVQGLWFIDHKDFEEGVRHLVNPSVHSELWDSWKHTAVINTLLAQSQGKAATRYLHTKHMLGGSPQEQELYVSVLIENRNVNQALEFVRGGHKESTTSSLMNHLLGECQKNKLLGQLLQLHLTDWEEDCLEQYLRGRAETHAMEPLLLYYLHHSRFLQAFHLNQDLNRIDKLDTSVAAQERSATRNRLVEAYLRALPAITVKLLKEKQQGSSSTSKHHEIERPKPLSTVVRNADGRAMSRSNFVMAVMEKVKEAEHMISEEKMEFNRERPADTQGVEHRSLSTTRESKLERNEVPFLSTPRSSYHMSLASSPQRVVHPELKTLQLSNNPLSVVKRKLLSESSPTSTNENRSLKLLTVECVQVLQTPKRGRKTQESSVITAGVTPLVKTPQSILKVRRLSKSMMFGSRDKLSGRRLSGTSPSSSKRPEKSKSEPSLPASPVSPSKETTPAVAAATPRTHANHAAVATPKHLRFMGLSPTPSPSPAQVSIVSSSPAEEIPPHAATVPVNEEQVTPPTSSPNQQEMEVDEKVETETEVTKNDMDISKSSEVSAERPSFEEGPEDRYSSTLGKLVRPDLQSPWKNTSFEKQDVTEVIVDEDITFLKQGLTGPGQLAPSMTSSPIDSGTQNELSSSGHSGEVIERKESSSVSQRVFTSETQEKLVTENILKIVTESHDFSSNLKHYELSPTVKESPKISPSLVLHSSSPVKSTRLSSLSPAETKYSKELLHILPQESEDTYPPPATPPLSKRAKLMFSNSEAAKNSPIDTHQSLSKSKLSPVDRQEEEPRRRKTPERRTPERGVSSRLAQKAAEQGERELSAERSSPPKSRRRITPDRRSPARKTLRSAMEEHVEMDELKDVEKVALQANEKADENIGNRKEIPELKDVKFVDAEKIIDTIPERDSSPDAPALMTRRRSARLNTPERSVLEGIGQEGTLARRALRDQSIRGSREESITLASTEDMTTKAPRSPGRKSSRQADSEILEGQDKSEASGERETSPLRRVRGKSKEKLRSPSRGKQITHAETEAVEVDRSNNLRPSKTPERLMVESQKKVEVESEHNLRRSKRQSKTPERRKEVESQRKVEVEMQSEHTFRRSERQSKTPERRKEVESQRKVEVEVQSELTFRRSSRQSKTPERLVSMESQEEEFELESEHNLRRSTRQLKAPERLIALDSQRKVDVDEKSELDIKQSRRQSKTPERVTRKESREPLTPTTKSKLKPKSPENLSTREIQTVEMEAPKETSSRPDSPQLPGSPDVSASPSRRSKRVPKSPERLNTDQIEPVSSHGSPTRLSSQSKSTIMASPARPVTRARSREPATPTRGNARGRKTPERTNAKDKTGTEDTGDLKETSHTMTKSPTRQSRAKSGDGDDAMHKAKGLVEDEEDWSEDMPSLRLEMDEDDGKTNKSKKRADIQVGEEESVRQQARTLRNTRSSPLRATRKPPVADSTLEDDAFIFSPPVKRFLRSVGPVEGEEGQPESEGLPFVFSQPTVAVEDSDGPATRKRKNKNKLYDGSPLLLSPRLMPSQKSMASKSTIQRASASILRRYKPQTVRSRRLKPSVKS